MGEVNWKARNLCWEMKTSPWPVAIWDWKSSTLTINERSGKEKNCPPNKRKPSDPLWVNSVNNTLRSVILQTSVSYHMKALFLSFWATKSSFMVLIIVGSAGTHTTVNNIRKTLCGSTHTFKPQNVLINTYIFCNYLNAHNVKPVSRCCMRKLMKVKFY